jgi:hypothetical protein
MGRWAKIPSIYVKIPLALKNRSCAEATILSGALQLFLQQEAFSLQQQTPIDRK